MLVPVQGEQLVPVYEALAVFEMVLKPAAAGVLAVTVNVRVAVP